MIKARSLWRSALIVCLLLVASQCVKRVNLPAEKRIVDPVASQCECKSLPEHTKIDEFILVGVEKFREMVDALNWCVETFKEENVNDTD